MKTLIFLLLTLLSSFGFACADVVCDELDKIAVQNAAVLASGTSGRKVIGKGRLQFYSAPAKKCEINGLFVIPGDELDASVEYGDFVAVTYLTKDGKLVDGWVERNRLIETGVGVGPNEF